jgi:hypothetical protein
MTQKIILWKLGNLKKGLFPTDKTVRNLVDILRQANKNCDGNIFNIIWGPDLEVEVIEGDINVLVSQNEDGTQSIRVIDNDNT